MMSLLPFPNIAAADTSNNGGSKVVLMLYGLINHASITIIPAAALLAAYPVHRGYFKAELPIKPHNGVLLSKLLFLATLGMVEAARALLCKYGQVIDNSVLNTSAILTTAASFCAMSMLYNENTRDAQPFSLVTIYLAIFGAVDAFRALLFAPYPQLHTISTLSAIAATLKFAVLLLEELTRRLDPKIQPRDLPNSGDRVGFWNQTLLLWFNSTILFGFRNILQSSNLPDLGISLASRTLHLSFQQRWTKVMPLPHRLVKTSVLALIRSIIISAIPRLCLTACNFLLPLVIQLTLNQTSESLPTFFVKLGLIVSVASVYTGIMLSRSSSTHYATCLATSLRGILSSAIIEKTMKLSKSVAKDAGTATLIGNDMDIVSNGIVRIHDMWISPLEAFLAIYCLSSSVGAACFVPLLPIAYSAISSWSIGYRLTDATGIWNKSIENRVTRMGLVLAQMKGIKMIGLEPILTQYMQRLRRKEIDDSDASRRLTVEQITLVPINAVFTPASLVISGVLMNKVSGYQVATMFTTLAYLVLLAEPMHILLRTWPLIGSMLAGFSRIEEFLCLTEHEDCREIRNFEQESKSESGLAKSRKERLVCLLDTSVASSTVDSNVLSNMQFTFSKSSLLLISGPVASGKSTLLKTILGETLLTGGSVHTATRTMAYCDQTPWLPRTTIRAVIVAESTFEAKRYMQVIRACCLLHDLEQLSKADLTNIGDNGCKLSGGQKQRIALARALYSDCSILVADNILGSLDQETADLVFEQVFGRTGILKAEERSAIMVTRSPDYLDVADQTLILDDAGNVTVRDGKSPQLPENIENDAASSNRARKFKKRAVAEATNILPKELQEETTRLQQDARLGNKPVTTDVNLYKRFFRAVSRRALVKWVFAMAAAAFLEKSPSIFIGMWLQFAPESKYWVFGLIILGCLGLVANRTASRSFLMSITPLISHDLHEELLHTIMRSSLPFLTAVGNGVLLNRSSQDMSVIGFELPLTFQRFVYSCFLTATDTIIIARATSYAWCVVPVVLASLWALQWFYMRTSRQLRMMELEAMSPLYTKLNEVIEGVEHIRAFGWQKQVLNQSLDILDASQKCFYYMRCVQRWLSLVLDLEVGIIGTALVAVVVNVEGVTSGPYLGIALVAIMTYSGNMQDLVDDGARADTALRAVARVHDLVENAVLEQPIVEPKVQKRTDGDALIGIQAVPSAAGGLLPEVNTISTTGVETTDAATQSSAGGISAEDSEMVDVQSDDEENASSIPATGKAKSKRKKINIYTEWPRSGNIELKNVSARYNTLSETPQMALDDVSLKITSGQKVAISGRTGSGKSTLFLTLLKFLEYTGTILIDGVDISKIPAHRLRAAITTIPQEHVDIPGSVRDNIVPMDILKEPGSGRVNNKAIRRVLRQLKLYKYIKARGGIKKPIERMEFSAGQKQLLSLARAMLHRLEYGSTIVLMDEASAHVDDSMERIMQRVGRTAFKDCTRLVISHQERGHPGSDVLVEFEDGAIASKTDVHKWTIEDEWALLLRTQDALFEEDTEQRATAQDEVGIEDESDGDASQWLDSALGDNDDYQTEVSEIVSLQHSDEEHVVAEDSQDAG